MHDIFNYNYPVESIAQAEIEDYSNKISDGCGKTPKQKGLNQNMKMVFHNLILADCKHVFERNA